MPYKPKRPCSHPGCPILTDERFCEEHAKQEAKRYEMYDRDPAVKKRYGRTWKRIRDRYIAAHPLCEQCQKHGKTTLATEAHHIKPLSQGGTSKYTNLMVYVPLATPKSLLAKVPDGNDGRGGQNLCDLLPVERAAGHARKGT